MTFSWLDVVVLTFTALQLVLAYRQGFAVGAILLVMDAAAIAGIAFTAPAIGAWAAQRFHWEAAVVAIAAAVAWFVLARALASHLTWRAYRLVASRRWLMRADMVAGLLPGLVVSWLGAVVGLWLYGAFVGPFPPNSQLSAAVQRSGEQAMGRVAHALPNGMPAIAHLPGGWTLVPGEAAGKAQAPSDLERQMLQRVNQERTKRGLKALAWDGRLADVGRAHSRDMLAKSYFAHEDPKGLTVADRARKAGVFYLVIGENLAFAPTLAIAHEGLMQSPGHRANILRPGFTRLGIGIVRVPRGSAYTPRHEGKAPPRPLRGFGDYLLVTQVFKR
jgi:uncharacterized protein YkwD